MASIPLMGPITTKRKKADLVDIAQALELDSAGTVKDLVKRIKQYTELHEARLSADPQFQQLFMYRPSAAGKGQAESKETGKTSADKAAEDILESQKCLVPATGSVKKYI